MKKSLIIKKLINENSKLVQVNAYNPIYNVGFQFCYSPIEAIRLIRILPTSFTFDFVSLS